MTKANPKPLLVPVSQRAIEARIRRALEKDGQQLKRNRSAQHFDTLGDLYIVDTGTNSVVASFCEIEELAAEMNILKPHERMENAPPGQRFTRSDR